MNYKMRKNGEWAMEHYMEIGVLAAAAASLMYTFGYLIRAFKLHG